MSLYIIIRNKFKFIRFIDNITIIIRNTIIRTRFYIINYIKIRVVLRFLFI